MIAIFPAAMTAIFFLYQYRNGFKFGVVSYLISIYLASSVCSLVLNFIFGYQDVYSLELFPVVFLAAMVVLVFFGFFGFKDRVFNEIVLTNIRLLKFLEYFMIPFSVLAFGFFLLNTYTALSGDVEAERNLIASGENTRLSSHGLLNSLCSLVANCFLFNMLFGFLNLTRGYPGHSLFKAVLHISLSTVYVLYILSYAGRDGVVYWVMSFVFFFLLFRDFLPLTSKRALYLGFAILFFPIFLVFIKISIARFGENGTGEVILSFFDYAGQQIFYFNDHFMVSPPPMHGAINFGPAFSLGTKLFDHDYEQFVRAEWFTFFLDRDVIPWVFTTFVGSFLHDFGRFGAFISCLILYGLAKYSVHSVKGGYMLLSDLIIFILIFQIVSWGVFYYRQYSAFIYILLILCFFSVFKFSGGTRQVVIKKEGDYSDAHNS